MCYNKEVSAVISLFALSTIIHLCLKYNETSEIKYIYAAVYILVLGLMQFVEFLLHCFGEKYKFNKNVEIKDKGYIIASVMVIVTIVLQFIASEVCIYKNGAPLPLLTLDVLFYCILFFSIYNIKDKLKFTYDFGSSWLYGCKLKWSIIETLYKNNENIIIILSIIYLIYVSWSTYLIFDIPGICILLVIFILSYFTSFNYAPGSAWCFIVLLLMLTISVSDSFLLEKSHV